MVFSAGLLAIFASFGLVRAASVCMLSKSAYRLPELHFYPRDDWINVKTDENAKGDGVADDTDPIQRALSRIQDNVQANGTKTVYFPPGCYRIRKTLIANHTQGGNVFGTGRNTVIAWDGDANDRMVWSDGAGRFRWEGLVFAGRGIAGVGLDHDSNSYYESRVMHRNLHFDNFTAAGLRDGHNQTVASAEMVVSNSLFTAGNSGISFLQWNDYDLRLTGSVFSNLYIGINAQAGNFYVDMCRFEGSADVDIVVPIHGLSVRQSISVGSKSFIRTTSGTYAAPIIINDCQVHGWTGMAAISTDMAGPFTVLDLAFRNPVNPFADGWVLNPRVGSNTTGPAYSIMLRGNVSYNGNGSAFNYQPGTALLATDVQVPKSAPPTAPISRDTVPFNSSEWNRWPRGRVYDAVTQFGARADGSQDSTMAIQAAVDHASEEGASSVAYLPPGKYMINDTINVTGSDFFFEGSGYGTMLTANTEHWSDFGKPLISVGCASGVTIGNMQAVAGGVNESAVASLRLGACSTSDYAAVGDKLTPAVQSSGSPSSLAGQKSQHLTLDGFFGQDDPTKNQPGVELAGLGQGDVVHALHLDGSLRVSNCSDATVLTNFHCGQGLTVEDARGDRRGQLVQLVRVSSAKYPVIDIRDSLSATLLDHYHEGQGTFMKLYGASPPGKNPGSVSVSNPKLNIGSIAGAPTVLLQDFDGFVAHTASGSGYAQAAYLENGTRASASSILLGGNVYDDYVPVFHFRKPEESLVLAGNVVEFLGNDSYVRLPEAAPSPAAQAAWEAFYTAIRQAGQLDVQLNFPQLSHG